MELQESLRPRVQPFHILFVDIFNPEGRLEKLPEEKYTKLLLLFHDYVEKCCNKLDVAFRIILESGVLIYVKADDTIAGALKTIKLALALKQLVESKIPFVKVKSSIHSEYLTAKYNSRRSLQEIEGPRADLISKMDQVAAGGQYSRIILSEPAYECLKNYVELTHFNRIVEDSLKGTKSLLKFLEVCDAADFHSIINDLYKRYRPEDISRSEADFQETVRNYDLLREEIRKYSSSQAVDHSTVVAVVVRFLEQLGFKINRIDRSRYHSDYLIRYGDNYLFLDVLPDRIDFAELESYESLKFQNTNRKLIIFLGDDSEVTTNNPDELFHRLKQNNLYLTLMSVNALMTMHNMICVSGFKERRAILSLLFSRTKHLLRSKAIEELQYRLMRMYMMKKIEQLKADLFLENKLSQMIQKVKNKTKDAASWDKIGEVIKLIETLSYQVLRIVNSPTTAYRRTNDITDASYQLGTEKLEQLLKTIRFSKLLPDEFPAYGTVRDSFWEHSVVTGLFVQKMAWDRQIRLKYFDGELQTEQVEDDFYSIGLLHDFGKVIFDQVFTVFYREVLAKEGKGYLASHENERKYPFDHAKVGAWAIKEADFPLQFARMVFYHHSPSKAEEDIKKLCCILYLAEYFLDPSYQPGAEGAQRMSPEEIEEVQWAADYLGTDLAQVAAVIDELQRGMESKKV